ncbi:hypothetical protein L484_018223 [Morus notabilis]|uniref:Uncharacterized protein n=1 Tax=Morus notabilis TaxID=981085 RepID=W9QFT4_9ROSA|nr:hypothetical protein L484_018223 [Morus notabilis]
MVLHSIGPISGWLLVFRSIVWFLVRKLEGILSLRTKAVLTGTESFAIEMKRDLLACAWEREWMVVAPLPNRVRSGLLL